MSDTFNHEADAWESLLFEDHDYDDAYDEEPPWRGKQPKTCRMCGKTGLYWSSVGGHWHLPHTCLPPSRDAILELRRRFKIGEVNDQG